MKRPRAVLIVSHGSREASANREFLQLVRKFQARHPKWNVTHAFLDVVGPSIPEALERLVHQSGPGEIQVLPYFLFRAKHVKKDIPAILKAFQKDYPRTQLRLAKPLGTDPRLLDILDKHLEEIPLK